ncbi:MAG: c-type cytochrome [Rubrimonas sp.]
MIRPLPLAAILAASALGGAALADTPAERARAAAGEILFEQKCRICHSANPETPSYGPSLVNVVGRAAGSYPDYDYSIALEASGIVWTPEALRAWMANNDGFMPGTKMRHVGVTDRAEQDFLVAYLESISQRDPKEIQR